MELYQPNYEYFSHLKLTDIVFDETRDLATLFGQYKEHQSAPYQECDFVCEFDVLGDLLLYAGEAADGITEALANGLTADYIASPTVIDITALAGAALEINDVQLKVYRPHEQNESGEWVESEDADCYCIASVQDQQTGVPEFRENLLPTALPRHITPNRIPPVETKTAKHLQHFADAFAAHLELLRESYQHYRNLVNQEFSKKSARRQSGLTDDMLFRLARLQDGMRSI